MRGEQFPHAHTPPWTIGSPPHARGAAAVYAQAIAGTRITPACAGSSFTHTHHHILKRDHPRMRGEQLSLKPFTRFPVGSPPHARGAGSINTKECFHRGITPAYAGSSARKEERRDTW